VEKPKADRKPRGAKIPRSICLSQIGANLARSFMPDSTRIQGGGGRFATDAFNGVTARRTTMQKLMRKSIMAALAAAALSPVAASAQPMGEVARDRQEMRHDRREVRQDMRHGDRRETRETREDWRDYRRAHRDAFRMRPYVGPRGFSYRQVGVGYRFAPGFYHQRYWIANPGLYRLPAPGAGLRWIRYGNDVVLINLRTGRVVQVYNSFFW